MPGRVVPLHQHSTVAHRMASLVALALRCATVRLTSRCFQLAERIGERRWSSAWTRGRSSCRRPSPASAPTASRSTRVAAREGAPLDRPTVAELADLGVLGLLLAEADGGVRPRRRRGGDRVRAARLAPRARARCSGRVLAAPLVDGAAAGDARRRRRRRASAVVDGAVARRARRRPRRAARRSATTASSPTAPPTCRRPTPLDPLDPLTPVGRVQRARRRRGRSAAPSAAGAAAAARHGAERGDARRRRRAGARGGPGLRPRARAVRCADRVVPGGQAPAGRHVRAQRPAPRARPTPRPRCSQDPGRDDPARAAAAAKLLAGEAAIANASTAIQVLGGMGFTWDMLPNHLLKRAWVLEHDLRRRPTTTPLALGTDARGGAAR